MATSEENDQTLLDGSDQELPVQEDAAEEQPYKPERTHVHVLLQISEEDKKESEPYEYHCYSGWEEAVRGWARVAPLSCILLPQRRDRRSMYKEADNPTSLTVEPTVCDKDRSARNAEWCSQIHVGTHNSFKRSMPSSQQAGPCSPYAAEALQPESPVLGTMQTDMSRPFMDEKIEEGQSVRGSPSQLHSFHSKVNKLSKPPKHKSRNIVVPIKNFTFLPPIKSQWLYSGRKAPQGETPERNCSMSDKRGGTRGVRVMYPAALTSKCQTCQHHQHLVPSVGVSLPKRYRVPVSSKPDTVH